METFIIASIPVASGNCGMVFRIFFPKNTKTATTERKQSRQTYI
ncbi:hypothetical protein [Kordia sp.]